MSGSGMGRRKFFQLAIGAGGMAALGYAWQRHSRFGSGGSTLSEIVKAGPALASLTPVTRKSYALGSEIEMTVLHADAEAGRKALDAAFEELETVESVMSVYRPQSQISRLNRDGVCNDPHPYFVACTKAAIDMSRRSNGAFDATVQPLWDLYSAAQKKNALPTATDLDTARKLVDWKKIECSDSSIRLGEKGMSLTYNGIAQGYAADRCADVLKKMGVEHALVNAGEINCIGAKQNSQPWSVGIQHPRKPNAYIAMADLNGLCLATSGDYATTFTPDFLYHHIFDPATGKSPLTFSSASIIAASATDADALTKVFFVGGVELGLKLLDETPKGAALLVYKDGRTFATRNFPFAGC